MTIKVGGRWRVGATPPASLPADVVRLITEHEAELDERERADYSWTLSWLEGHPNLALDDGTEILWDSVDGVPYLRTMC